MLLSKTVKFIFLLGALLSLPSLADARIIEFDDKKWDVEINTVVVNNSPNIRTADLTNDVKQMILGTRPAVVQSKVLSQASVEKIIPILEEVNQPTKSAKLSIENGWAKEFEPGQDGQAVDVYNLVRNLTTTEGSLTLPVLVSYPQTRLSDTNNLGITELVAVGESDFRGSPSNRRVNIRVGANKFNGLVVAPGEEFSFNKFLGDVDAANGFLPELVIKSNGLVPEFGGGLCQVSSTVFRAAMNAGLPITERRNHSFAVQYYAPQGTDATIYPGVVDLKFVNDLPGHLLIQPRMVGDKLYFDFYGTKDKREIAFEGPYQYDKQASGAMKAIWTRRVSKNGKTDEQVFRSNYVSPALFPKQSTVQSSTPNPESENSQQPDTSPAPDTQTTETDTETSTTN